MKNCFTKILVFLLVLIVNQNITNAQAIETIDTSFRKTEHRFGIGLGLGGSMPIPIPNRFSELSWSPYLCYDVHYDFDYRFNQKIGLKTGLRLRHEGMNAQAKVYQIFTNTNVEDAEVSGYFSGYNETNIRNTYVSVPVIVSCRTSQKWSFNVGAFASVKIMSIFNGAVKDGYIRVSAPTGSKVDIGREEFEFDDAINTFDYGCIIGAERNINTHLSAWLDLSYSLSPLFKSSFTALDYDLHNIYAFVGVNYKL